MHSKSYLLILTIVLSLAGCHTHEKNKRKYNLSVNWELLSNIYTDCDRAKAVFTLTNHSQHTLKASEWELYFNMAPRTIIPSTDTAWGDIEWISGDWYKLVPRKKTKLKPEISVQLFYEFQGWQIKESDAPSGLYFVWKNNRNKEEIFLPSNYTITPFTRENQVKRSKYDQEPLPTPENRYSDYSTYYNEPATSTIPVIPSPYKMNLYSDIFTLDPSYAIVYDKGLEEEATWLDKKLYEFTGINLPLQEHITSPGASIQLVSQPITINGKQDESYTMKTAPGSIVITGSKTGVFYGIESLLHLVPDSVYKNKPGKILLPSLYIEDTPRFSYRGLHIDVSRNFESKEQIKKILDLMAFYKLNVLYLYLADDEGWRLEIEGLPELTEIGSRRGHTIDEKEFLHPSYGSGPFPDADNNHGSGYYTRNDFKEIIQYAHQSSRSFACRY